MSLRKLSPTANLLRASRLFSLPPPLSRPAPDGSAISVVSSDTATTQYPTHAAIETTQSSLARGDWGLKRALPLKSTTKTSTPIIYIDNIDSIDHITDFGSAADHALTVRKWQQLDMPISLPEKQVRASGLLPASSVFDSQYDSTNIRRQNSARGPRERRWKFQGPWLAGKTDGEFDEYLDKKVKKRKSDFRRYLVENLAQKRATSQRREAIERGEDLNELAAASLFISEEDMEAFIRQLRNDEQELHRLIEMFLDLPRAEDSSSPYVDRGPPTTHPSGGLSYLRTDAHIVNHPELGPLEFKTPVQGRIVEPQKTRGRKNLQGLIGVAGVVGNDGRKTGVFKDGEIPGMDEFDPDVPGGAKIWTSPKRASIDPRGRIEFTIDRADLVALNIVKGIYTEGPPNRAPSTSNAAAFSRKASNLAPSQARNPRVGRGYGLEDAEGTSNSSGRATPFLDHDDEVPPDMLTELLQTGRSNPRK